MADHENYAALINIGAEDETCDDPDNEEIIVEEKSGDKFLIKLYRERSFLYDKKNPNFKDTSMKENGWEEISKIMIETNCGNFLLQLFIELFEIIVHVFIYFIYSLIVIIGDMYTPQYCQRRCCSLREQYNREKKYYEVNL